MNWLILENSIFAYFFPNLAKYVLLLEWLTYCRFIRLLKLCIFLHMYYFCTKLGRVSCLLQLALHLFCVNDSDCTIEWHRVFLSMEFEHLSLIFSEIDTYRWKNDGREDLFVFCSCCFSYIQVFIKLHFWHLCTLSSL